MALKVLIVGGVALRSESFRTARLRRLRPDAGITIIEMGGLVSYGACGIPYYVEGVFPEIDDLSKTPAGVSRTPAFLRR